MQLFIHHQASNLHRHQNVTAGTTPQTALSVFANVLASASMLSATRLNSSFCSPAISFTTSLALSSSPLLHWISSVLKSTFTSAPYRSFVALEGNPRRDETRRRSSLTSSLEIYISAALHQLTRKEEFCRKKRGCALPHMVTTFVQKTGTYAGTSPFFSSEVLLSDLFVRRIDAEPLWSPMTSTCWVGVPVCVSSAHSQTTAQHVDIPEKGLESVTCHSPDGGGATWRGIMCV